MSEAAKSTIDQSEVDRFSAMAAEWWSPTGKFKPLHKFNPVRLTYIRDKASENFGRDAKSPQPLEGLRVLDIGCGGGLLSEPVARMGATVVGADPSEKNIGIASTHAKASGVAVDYRAVTAEQLAEAGETFDIVLNMEVVEHVADVDFFMSDLRQDGAARRPDVRRHHQPHDEGGGARDLRRREHPALASARHASI